MLPLPPLIVLVGPTAVGKTSTAIYLANRLNGEIVSADSRLFYRGMDIGTAKPSPHELAQVRHHMIDVADIHADHKLPILVGGTGQYIHAVTGGWTPPPVEPNDTLRDVLSGLAVQQGHQWLHNKLRILDHAAADSIDPRNVRRTVRALEVIFTSGSLFSAQKLKKPSPYLLVQVGLTLPRKELYQRIDARIENMFERGLLQEVESLLDKGFSSDLPTMSAIGYRECVNVLEEKITVEEAKVKMRRSTRIYVRRQANWFKENDPEIKWFSLDSSTEDEIASYINKCLTTMRDFSN
jgi:tRNA dimethylallyltransferase